MFSDRFIQFPVLEFERPACIVSLEDSGHLILRDERFGQLFLCSQLISYAYFNVSSLVLGREKNRPVSVAVLCWSSSLLGPLHQVICVLRKSSLAFFICTLKEKKQKRIKIVKIKKRPSAFEHIVV